jgi:replicative DNA helicase
VGGIVNQPILPHDKDAEMAVVASLLINPDVIPLVLAILRPDDFYEPRCRKIFTVERDLGQGLDVLTVQAELERRGWLDQVGPAFITGTILQMPCSYHGEYYAGLVRDLSRRRQLIQLAARLTKSAFAPGEDSADDLISTFGRELLALARHGAGAAISAPEAATAVQETVARWAADPLPPGGVRGLSCGLQPVDDVLNGMRRGDLILLAARPSMGKSALGFEIARRVASRGLHVLIFSLEMGWRQVVGRWASALSGVHVSRMERGLCPPEHAGTANQILYPSPPEFEAYNQALVEIQGYETLTINDQASLRTEQIRAQALARAARSGGLDLVVVDHTGLIDPGPGRQHHLTAAREGAKSRAMKALAKELSAPLILLQQLNRGVEARQDKRPGLADLRDSGEHEENADIVLALYSRAYYQRKLQRQPDELEILCLKHRHGPGRTSARLFYQRPLSRFTERTAS